MNEERVKAFMVIQTIRNAPIVCQKSPYEQWLCDMWNIELTIDREQTEIENKVIVEREMNKIRKRRMST